MNTHKIYDVVTTIGFFLFAGGLVISKFAVTLGIIFLALTAPLILLSRKIKIKRHSLKPFYALVLTFLMLSVSALYSSNQNNGFHELIIQNGLSTLPILFFIHWAQFKRRVIQITQFLFFIAAIASVCTLIFYFAPVDIAKGWTNRFSIFQEYPEVINKTQFGLYSPFIDRLHFAYALSFCVISSLYLSFRTDKWIYKILCGFFLFIILILGARGAQLALLFSCLPFLVYQLKSTHPEMKIFSWHSLVFSISFLLVVPVITYELIPSVKSRYNQMRWELDVIKDGSYINHDYQHFTTLTRLKSFEHSIDIIKDNPVFGTGIGDVENDLWTIHKDKSPNIPAHHQNYYLYLWMAGGIVTLVVFVAFQCFWLQNFIKMDNSILNKSFAVSYSIFVAAILLIDAVMKYHLGVFGIPFFFMVIMAFSESPQIKN
tara:strand:+ start:4622 stop:5911 length:1290 start_codon:yes stop_codon:yes gene_type:complete